MSGGLKVTKEQMQEIISMVENQDRRHELQRKFNACRPGDSFHIIDGNEDLFTWECER